VDTQRNMDDFLHDTMIEKWGVNPGKINIMAHSLGNLVMWDALRLGRILYGDTPLVNNVGNIQAAVWEETFWEEAPVIYDNEPNFPKKEG